MPYIFRFAYIVCARFVALMPIPIRCFDSIFSCMFFLPSLFQFLCFSLGIHSICNTNMDVPIVVVEWLLVSFAKVKHCSRVMSNICLFHLILLHAFRYTYVAYQIPILHTSLFYTFDPSHLFVSSLLGLNSFSYSLSGTHQHTHSLSHNQWHVQYNE